MSKSKKQAASTSYTAYLELIESWISRHLNILSQSIKGHYQEIFGIMLIGMSILALLNLTGLSEGAFPTILGDYVGLLFGWGAMPMMLAAAILGGKLLWLAFDEQEQAKPVVLESLIGLEISLWAGLGFMHIVAGNDLMASAYSQAGGGLVGWAIATLLADLLGPQVSVFIFLGWTLLGLGLILRFSYADMWQGARQKLTHWAYAQGSEVIASSSLAESPQPIPAPQPAPPKKKAAASSNNKPKKKKKTLPPLSVDEALAATAMAHTPLPPLALLAASEAMSYTTTKHHHHQARVIEETLLGFGIPADVVEVNQGPSITQFGLKPGTIMKKMSDGRMVEQRIRVNKISALVNDLALALSAAPIRIETPVPGRPIVGIEVPNQTLRAVSLREVMETDIFRKAKGNLVVGLGRGVSGRVSAIDLTKMPHLLIAGATGAGKSVCINTIVTTLLMTHTPETLRFLMIDPKMVELTSYNSIPHLIAPVVTDFEQVGGALAWATREMERRYKAFAKVQARSILSYNSKVPDEEQEPFLVVIIDELADLMMLAADEVERHICRIAQMARATGIHLIIATQRPSTDVVTGLIKANFPARIAFAVSSQIDSRVIIDAPGADKLLGRGDMLYMAPDSPKLARLQGCFVDESEIQAVVSFWQQQNTLPKTKQDEKSESEVLPWADILEEAGKDDLLEKAIALVMENERASTTLLQRKLGLGYPRASRLMDQLEAEGVIGPAEGNAPRPVLWSKETPPEIDL